MYHLVLFEEVNCQRAGLEAVEMAMTVVEKLIETPFQASFGLEKGERRSEISPVDIAR